MKAEERNLLLKDLCARLPYQPKVKVDDDEEPYTLLAINANKKICVIGEQFDDVYATSRAEIERIKPFLRPMSSMTEDERKEYELLANRCIVTSIGFIHLEAAALIDFLNENHFDYLGSIGKGLAIEVTEENNPYKN